MKNIKQNMCEGSHSLHSLHLRISCRGVAFPLHLLHFLENYQKQALHHYALQNINQIQFFKSTEGSETLHSLHFCISSRVVAFPLHLLHFLENYQKLALHHHALHHINQIQIFKSTEGSKTLHSLHFCISCRGVAFPLHLLHFLQRGCIPAASPAFHGV